MLDNGTLKITMESLTDPAEQARSRRRHEQFRRNAAWLEAHAHEVFMRHRGKCICIAGQELFVADLPEAAYELARQAHPDDDGPLVRYIPIRRGPRIYAYVR